MYKLRQAADNRVKFLTLEKLDNITARVQLPLLNAVTADRAHLSINGGSEQKQMVYKFLLLLVPYLRFTPVLLASSKYCFKVSSVIFDFLGEEPLLRPLCRSGISSFDGLAKGFSDITIMGDPSASFTKKTIDCFLFRLEL